MKTLVLEFGFDLTFDASSVPSPAIASDANCAAVFDSDSYALLGSGPRCGVGSSSDRLFEVQLGFRHSVTVYTELQFREDVVLDADACGTTTVQKIHEGVPAFNEPLPEPTLVLRGPSNSVSVCQDVYIEVDSLTGDLGRGIYKYTWALAGMLPLNIEGRDVLEADIQELNNYNSEVLYVQQLRLLPNTQYQFRLFYDTVVGTYGVSDLTVRTLAYEGISVEFESLQKKYFVWQNLDLIASGVHYKCDPARSQATTFARRHIVEWRQINGSEVLGLPSASFVTKLHDVVFNATIRPFRALPNQVYAVELRVSDPGNLSIFGRSVINLRFGESNVIAFVAGGDR